MITVNIILCAFISAACGGRFDTKVMRIPRFLLVVIFALITVINLSYLDFWYLSAWLSAFIIIRLLPTAGLITAAENTLPVRDGSYLRIKLYDITMTVWKRLPEFMTSWHYWGIIYGVIRTIPILPIAWYLNNGLLYFSPLIGVLYCLIGIICRKINKGWKPVTWAEIAVGAFIGASL